MKSLKYLIEYMFVRIFILYLEFLVSTSHHSLLEKYSKYMGFFQKEHQ